MMWLLELLFDQNLIMINIIKGTQERHEHEGCDLFFFFFLIGSLIYFLKI